MIYPRAQTSGAFPMPVVNGPGLLFCLLLLLLEPHSPETACPALRRFEYKLSFKGPRLALPGAGIPFWSHHGGEGQGWGPAMPRVPQSAGGAVTWWGVGLSQPSSVQGGVGPGTVPGTPGPFPGLSPAPPPQHPRPLPRLFLLYLSASLCQDFCLLLCLSLDPCPSSVSLTCEHTDTCSHTKSQTHRRQCGPAQTSTLLAPSQQACGWP